MNSQFNLLKAFIRIIALQYFLDIVFLIVGSPERFLIFFAHSQTQLSCAAFSALVSMIARFFIYLILGVGLWFFAEPIAKFVGRELAQEV
jgi:hypothetical protein